MAVQSSQSAPGLFKAAIAAAQAGYGRAAQATGAGDDGIANEVHGRMHSDHIKQLRDHAVRIGNLEELTEGLGAQNDPGDPDDGTSSTGNGG